MILRMMVRRPETGFCIPEQLEWLAPAIGLTDQIQRVNNIPSQFVYVTVRSGIVTSTTDDLWHVDGFSMRVPHIPEQNYIWTDKSGTEELNQKIDLPEDFDPLKHNIHQYFQDVARPENRRTLEEKTLYGIDPYVIHRRPPLTAGIRRTFFRISYVPIEIEDDTCMINPYMPKRALYGRKDIRYSLDRYSVQKQS